MRPPSTPHPPSSHPSIPTTTTHTPSNTPPSTGATGYIGGDAIHTLHTAHPDWSYTVLARRQEKGELVQTAFPNVRPVYADLDDSELIEREAAAADVVLRELASLRCVCCII